MPQITEALPELGPAVHAQLLNLLSMALREQAFFATRPSYAEALKEAVRTGGFLNMHHAAGLTLAASHKQPGEPAC